MLHNTDFGNSAVFVFDPTDLDVNLYNIPVGKQTRVPEHIFYRSCTGIWQTVWMEHVPDTYVSGLAIAAGMDGKGETHHLPENLPMAVNNLFCSGLDRQCD